MDFSIETLKQETAAVMEELFRNCSEGHYTLRKGDILVIGCSTSKVMGFHMGTLFTGLHLPPALCKTIRRSSFPSLRFVVVLLFPRILYTPFAFFVKSLLYKPPQNS